MSSPYTPPTSPAFANAALQGQKSSTSPKVLGGDDPSVPTISVETYRSSLEIYEIFRADQEAEDNARLNGELDGPSPAPGF